MWATRIKLGVRKKKKSRCDEIFCIKVRKVFVFGLHQPILVSVFKVKADIGV